MATNFGTKIAINWLCVNDSDKAIGYGGVWVIGRQNADIADTLHLRDVAMTTMFWLPMYWVYIGATPGGHCLPGCPRHCTSCVRPAM